MDHYGLALSLGHNSSAIAIKNGIILGGYEEERFTQKKADSVFPINSICALAKQLQLPDNTDIYVSNWFLDGKLPSSNKYWRPEFLTSEFKGRIFSVNTEFSHHDAHMRSAQVFAGNDFPSHHHIFVMDGFGTHGECISIYESNDGEVKLLSRLFGFNHSLGMFYQYATAFCGMKMNNHEYKMLAYETHINEVGIYIGDINEYIDDFVEKKIKSTMGGMISPKMDPMISLDALHNTTEYVHNVLRRYLERFGMAEADTRTQRIMVSYFAQRYVERMVLLLCESIEPTNLLVVGGLFYNVKINHLLCNAIPGKFCVMPLAGDQGAALGVYSEYAGDLLWPDHLFWGKRKFDRRDLSLMKQDGVIITESTDEAMAYVINELYRIGFVNYVQGAMEFGPRALCHTTTFALPNQEVGALVNQMNDRTNEMPFALVVTQRQAEEHFKGIDKVHKSLEYMIMAREFSHTPPESMLGGAHYYPYLEKYTCRPQIAREAHILDLLEVTGPLINTSWNYHGVPIVNTTEQLIYTHMNERARIPEHEVKTVVVID